MKLTHFSLLVSFALQAVYAFPNFQVSTLKPRRTRSLLISPPAMPALPSAQQAASASASVGLNLTDIQGDILIGMKKNKELFFFFSIVDPTTFKSQLGSSILPMITSTDQLLAVSTQPITSAVNIAFSQSGLTALGIKDDLGDDKFFSAGQFSGATGLGDQTNNWVPAFAGTSIHGVFLVASDTVDNVNATLSQIQNIMNGSISEVYRLQGQARPGDEQGHEHFGFMDGISNPAVSGFSTPKPGQTIVDSGVILVSEQGDPKSGTVTRPPWAKDGSFLVFRQLQQRVPEFNKFLADNALSEPNQTADGAELLGARMMGRWKSGAPIDLAPLADDPDLATDPQRNNDFNFTHSDLNFTTDQTHCPFSAHIRKTNPRADISVPFDQHIIRAGIPYGPEVTDDENASNSSSTDPSLERGLAFVAYQADISTGFQFLQVKWANNAKFHTAGVGVDPIIGVASGDGPRTPAGLDPDDSTRVITITEDFVVSRGGEYFFSPSLSAIQNTLSV